MRTKGLVTTLYAENDLLKSLLACFFIAVALLLAVEHKKASDEDSQTKGGNLSVYIEWPYEHDVDVDLWFEYPECDACPVMYANLQARKGWIGRDDTGNGVSLQNNENAMVYDLAPGEYVFNIHAWGERNHKFPVPVFVEIKYRDKENRTHTVTKETFVLNKTGDEITAARFVLDKNQKLVSQSKVFKSLVGPYKKAQGEGTGRYFR